MTDAKAVDDGFREFIRPVALPLPLQTRNTPPAENAGERAARGETKNSLHIGKIEVQVVPPRSSGRQASPSKPTGRLARGYALWTNWQQQ